MLDKSDRLFFIICLYTHKSSPEMGGRVKEAAMKNVTTEMTDEEICALTPKKFIRLAYRLPRSKETDQPGSSHVRSEVDAPTVVRIYRTPGGHLWRRQHFAF